MNNETIVWNTQVPMNVQKIRAAKARIRNMNPVTTSNGMCGGPRRWAVGPQNGRGI